MHYFGLQKPSLKRYTIRAEAKFHRLSSMMKSALFGEAR